MYVYNYVYMYVVVMFANKINDLSTIKGDLWPNPMKWWVWHLFETVPINFMIFRQKPLGIWTWPHWNGQILSGAQFWLVSSCFSILPRSLFGLAAWNPLGMGWENNHFLFKAVQIEQNWETTTSSTQKCVAQLFLRDWATKWYTI